MVKPKNISCEAIAIEAKVSPETVARYFRLDGKTTSTEMENRIVKAIEKLKTKTK
jgi:DNA-binding LacI/PurR family transcriptional regulator